MQEVRRVDAGGSKIPQREKVGHLQDHEVKQLNSKDASLGINISVPLKGAQKHTLSSTTPDPEETRKTNDLIGRVFRY